MAIRVEKNVGAERGGEECQRRHFVKGGKIEVNVRKLNQRQIPAETDTFITLVCVCV